MGQAGRCRKHLKGHELVPRCRKSDGMKLDQFVALLQKQTLLPSRAALLPTRRLHIMPEL